MAKVLSAGCEDDARTVSDSVLSDSFEVGSIANSKQIH